MEWWEWMLAVVMAWCVVALGCGIAHSIRCRSCRAALRAMRERYPDYQMLSTDHRATECLRDVVAVFYQLPRTIREPSPYWLIAVGRDGSIHELPVVPDSPYLVWRGYFRGIDPDETGVSKMRRALKAELATQPEPHLVPIERFFDGNDDLGSIGCNLAPHPGLARFRQVLTGLLSRPDVQAVYAQIEELDPGDECWPFADTVLVVGTIPTDELRELVDELQPNDVRAAEVPAVAERHGEPVSVVWWD